MSGASTFAPRELSRFITQCRLGVLGSICAAGTPQAAVVGVAVNDDLEIIFDTVKNSRKYPNLLARPVCSFVFWDGERTVQYEGEAQELHSPELARYQEAYFQAWPECRAHLSWPGITYFVVKPGWIRYSDFDQTPPFIQEFQL